MKKYLLFAIALIQFSCNDGDLQIETVDFDSIETVQFCETVVVNAENLLFKINGDEALIIELPSNLLKNEITTTDITSQVPSATQITYRIFSDNVSNNYFCDAIPPLTPSVIEEIGAQDGQIFITTVAGEGDTFVHTIRLSGISFVAENGSRITNLEINEFGTVTTSL
ncbi:hypothetical protein BFP77_05225 [Maribacter sp. 4U21]|uniref:hypothetical protein n=1 Tax=Maribacter sp. 4U21 TaxID=1889779 RepID=UPI000C155CE4|nr:hypothetical protein [Maribacter sp. 4U21]PIB30022.1 hypothetical protein BFP77_05225 [Maribacter sp. 4U21]